VNLAEKLLMVVFFVVCLCMDVMLFIALKDEIRELKRLIEKLKEKK